MLQQNLTNAFLSQTKHTNLPLYDRKVFISYAELLPVLYELVRNAWQNFINHYCSLYRDKLKEINKVLRNVILQDADALKAKAYTDSDDRQIEIDPYLIKCDSEAVWHRDWRGGGISQHILFAMKWDIFFILDINLIIRL